MTASTASRALQRSTSCYRANSCASPISQSWPARICDISQRTLVHPDHQITAAIQGPAIYLPSKQATALALVLNELVANAFEHAFAPDQPGSVRIELAQRESRVTVSIVDNGRGMPPEFYLEDRLRAGPADRKDAGREGPGGCPPLRHAARRRHACHDDFLQVNANRMEPLPGLRVEI